MVRRRASSRRASRHAATRVARVVGEERTRGIEEDRRSTVPFQVRTRPIVDDRRRTFPFQVPTRGIVEEVAITFPRSPLPTVRLCAAGPPPALRPAVSAGRVGQTSNTARRQLPRGGADKGAMTTRTGCWVVAGLCLLAVASGCHDRRRGRDSCRTCFETWADGAPARAFGDAAAVQDWPADAGSEWTPPADAGDPSAPARDAAPPPEDAGPPDAGSAWPEDGPADAGSGWPEDTGPRDAAPRPEDAGPRDAAG